MNTSIPPMGDAKEQQKRIVAEVHQLRGVIIGCYAPVEFLLADICMKAWMLPEYQHLKRKFPYSIEDRIKGATALFACEGRLRRYAPEVEGVFQQLKKYEQYRHFIAHGLCVVTSATEPIIVFHLWRPAKNAGAQIGTIEMALEQMTDNANEIALYSNAVIRLFYRVYLEQDLNIPEEMLGPPTA